MLPMALGMEEKVVNKEKEEQEQEEYIEANKKVR